MERKNVCGAKEALERLKAGNLEYVKASVPSGDISPRRRESTLKEGQAPFAVIVTCSDSRVLPESIFSCGIGDIFVVRVAGNVIDDHQLGSIEYAASHLGCRLVVVLGHTHCGAVEAAAHGDAEGYIKFITDEIRKAVGDEKDGYKCCALNVLHSVSVIEESLDIRREEKQGLIVLGAIYRLEDGRVEYLGKA